MFFLDMIPLVFVQGVKTVVQMKREGVKNQVFCFELVLDLFWTEQRQRGQRIFALVVTTRSQPTLLTGGKSVQKLETNQPRGISRRKPSLGKLPRVARAAWHSGSVRCSKNGRGFESRQRRAPFVKERVGKVKKAHEVPSTHHSLRRWGFLQLHRLQNGTKGTAKGKNVHLCRNYELCSYGHKIYIVVKFPENETIHMPPDAE